MAITFHQIPKAISPSDNPLMYEFSSNQTAQANFTYVCDVYFNGSIVGQSRVVVGSGIKARLDIREWVSALVLPATINDNDITNVSFGKIKLKVTESYGTTPTLQATATSSETKIFKARISERRFITEDFATNYKQLLWLSNKPDQIIKVPTATNAYLSMIIDGTAHVYIDFTANGVFLGTFEDDYTMDIMQVNLNNSVYGFPTATNASVYIDGSQVFNVEFLHNNCMNQNILYWVNEYGQIEQYYFDHNTQFSGSTKQLGYSKAFGEWVGGSFTYNQNAGNRNHLVQTTKTVELHSDYMDGQTQNWLNECIESPRHWVGEDSYTLETASYVDEDERFEDLIAYTVKLSDVFTKNSPRL